MLDTKFQERFNQSPVIPIIIPGVSFQTVDEAVEVGKALKKGGVMVLEILLRGTQEQQALAAAALTALRAEPDTADILLCAGTINDTDKMRMAVDAGADFMVSADAQTAIVSHWQEHYRETLFAPTALTTTEVANLLAITPLVKLFPTNQLSQKDAYLNSLKAIYGQKGALLLSYDVTTPANIIDLQHSMVVGIAAAWMAPAALIQEQKWDQITEIAQQTLIAAEQARQKQFSALRESTTRLFELSGLEPTHKDQSVQADLGTSLSEYVGKFFADSVGTANSVLQDYQPNCAVM